MRSRSPAADLDAQKLSAQADHDLAKRAGAGVLTYPVAWLLIVSTTSLPSGRDGLFYFCGALILSVGAIRPFLVWRIDWLYERSPALWRGLFRAGSIAAAVSWGAFFSVAVYGRPLDSAAMLMIAVTAGIAAGAMVSLAPDRRLALAHISLLLAPAALVLFLSKAEGDLALGALFLLFYAYVATTSGVVHEEYWRGLKSQAKLEWLATRDALTGALNRRSFDERLPNEMERARRYATPLSLVMLDIDNFKQVNDRHGHKAGDSLLIELTSVVDGQLREPDILVRWGGEEFMVIAPHTDLEGGRELAERLRLRIAEREFGEAGRITCSFGVSERRNEDTPDSLMVRADDALYRAKSAGRNRVEVRA